MENRLRSKLLAEIRGEVQKQVDAVSAAAGSSTTAGTAMPAPLLFIGNCLCVRGAAGMHHIAAQGRARQFVWTAPALQSQSPAHSTHKPRLNVSNSLHSGQQEN